VSARVGPGHSHPARKTLGHDVILRALDRANGNVNATAGTIGVPPRPMEYMIERLKIRGIARNPLRVS
jgi:hypothetical protein